ncbi:type I secretion system permease/ATPase [Luminiphilus sp. nBUS_16]|uniref:type I secretion system permease/ATPase n=1 Tax=Luminiphilus sp. nBUS_16 TaxID=3395315 RepID=UPI003EB8907E
MLSAQISAQVRSIEDALRMCKRSFTAVFIFSFFTNMLMLTPMFYMINVFDKAVGTGSFPTLISLVIIAGFLYVIMALLEWSRSRVLIYIATRMDHVMAPRIYDICFLAESGGANTQNMGSQPLSDLNSLRQFLAGGTVLSLFDLPWLPVYLLVMVLFHPALAVVALICMGIMFALALANQKSTTEGLKELNEASSSISRQTSRNLRNAEVASAMGMISTLTEKWRIGQDHVLEKQERNSATAAGYSATIKSLTTAMQSAAITTGAVLAMQQQISPGVMIGAALLLGRSLAPIQQAVGGWKGLVDAKLQYSRLNDLLQTFPPIEEQMPLPPIKGDLFAKNVTVVPPGGQRAILTGISFHLCAGTTTMVMGSSAAGKSTLVRTILGLWPTAAGEMRIDGAEAALYDRDTLGPQIGYLPQDIELFDGSVASNIARFTEADPELVVQAARDADVHEMILALPQGYDTVISAQQGLLSPGQRQRIALARALYNRPKLVVLDEPNSNLDESGERALNGAIKMLKAAGSTVVLVSHRNGALPLADGLLVMVGGKIADQGPTADVIARAKQVIATKQEALDRQSDKAVAVEEQHAH